MGTLAIAENPAFRNGPTLIGSSHVPAEVEWIELLPEVRTFESLAGLSTLEQRSGISDSLLDTMSTFD